MIAIIDYGMGNLASVKKAVEFLGGRAVVTSDPQQIVRAKGIIFPGVGAFGAAMRELKRRKLIGPLRQAIHDNKPFLGLCLGMQLLFEASDESPGVKGLGIFSGRVRKLPSNKGVKIPHMGWNRIVKMGKKRNPLLEGVPDGSFVYFVHSYVVDPRWKGLTAARTDYGKTFPSVLWNTGKIWATQFHPEKSQRHGLKILKNFIRQVEKC
ncbi:MAG: imidazole glycerol phosphate synthase subunit HisH [Candidatus Omnitrophica bacterium]|nr:imidazole glycerol phosphate synthase subunit HisH [Candidatus Omnitrophota bacterium]